MRVAVVSDIHGNSAALDAVLADVATRGAELIVNLGDICSGPLFPRETADRLMQLNLPSVRGNHERQLLTQRLEDMNLSDGHAARAMRADQLAWLASLPSVLRPVEGVLMTHGAPDDDLRHLLETVTREGIRPASEEEILERMGAAEARVILCGHSHRPGARTLRDGRLIVNPGSVGLQAYRDDLPHPHAVETGSPHARYAIIANSGEGWSAEFFAVDYDWDQAALMAEKNGRPDWAQALRTGRA